MTAPREARIVGLLGSQKLFYLLRVPKQEFYKSSCLVTAAGVVQFPSVQVYSNLSFPGDLIEILARG